jgi:hypothetical protein
MVIIKCFGRKKMLLKELLGMIAHLALISLAFLQKVQDYILLALLIVFIALFDLSQDAVIWILLSEILPNNVRSRGASIRFFPHWFLMESQVFYFRLLQGAISADVELDTHLFSMRSLLLSRSPFSRGTSLRSKGRASRLWNARCWLELTASWVHIPTGVTGIRCQTGYCYDRI